MSSIIPPSDPLQGISPTIRSLLDRLHALSLAQEAALQYTPNDSAAGGSIHDTMRDKFIALEQDKCQFVYQLCRATGAKTIVEAGTSYGVSTIYLALAAAANARATGGAARVVATEHEPEKAAQARKYWDECGEDVSGVIEMREGDLRETLKTDLENVDFLLLDIWTPMALPTLKVVQPKMRYGAIVVADNTAGAAESYRDLLEYMRDPASGFVNSTLPFHRGLEVSVYLPEQKK